MFTCGPPWAAARLRCLTSAHHVQPCGFPGRLRVNSSHSHKQASHTRAFAIKAHLAAGRRCSHLNVNIHTLGAEPRVGKEGCLCNATFFFFKADFMTLDSTLTQCYCTYKRLFSLLVSWCSALFNTVHTPCLLKKPCLCSSEPIALWGDDPH